MFRALVVFLLTAILASAATIRLYLKDGEYQLVREYKVQGDRVRYYSVERGDWEEIPLELVDMRKTESEIKRRDAEISEEAKSFAEEEAAERAARKEVERIPVEPGVYLILGDDLKTIVPAESKVVGNKRRSILKAVTPIPIVSGKGTLELDGEHSPNIVNTPTPEFYIRLSAEERFGIVKMGEKKGVRVAEKFDIIPVSREIIEEQNEVQVFRHQVGDMLYKIWPMKPLEPGEYGVVQYSPATNGSINLQVWDFAFDPKGTPTVAPPKPEKSK